jgi:NAD(P)H-hydrate epimerase
MSTRGFRTRDGIRVPAVTAEQMRQVDRIVQGELGLSMLQMTENAGRSLAENVMDMLGVKAGRAGQGQASEITILAGAGGNGGAGLCCARHLHNRGFRLNLMLDREAVALHAAAGNQLQILREVGLRQVVPLQAEEVIRRADLVVDALIGYSLRGKPQGRAADLIELCNQHAARVLSVDIPSGLDATTGEARGLVVRADRTLTLALPKTGLQGLGGELYLADLGIPPEVYEQIDVSYESPFTTSYWVPLEEA